jgi:hypothetical protein
MSRLSTWGSTNPLIRRVRRHAGMATLFRSRDSDARPETGPVPAMVMGNPFAQPSAEPGPALPLADDMLFSGQQSDTGASTFAPSGTLAPSSTLAPSGAVAIPPAMSARGAAATSAPHSVVQASAAAAHPAAIGSAAVQSTLQSGTTAQQAVQQNVPLCGCPTGGARHTAGRQHGNQCAGEHAATCERVSCERAACDRNICSTAGDGKSRNARHRPNKRATICVATRSAQRRRSRLAAAPEYPARP